VDSPDDSGHRGLSGEIPADAGWLERLAEWLCGAALLVMIALIGAEALLFGLQKLLEGSAAWNGPQQPVRRGPAVFWSALSGFTSFVSHAGGPPMMQFLMPLKLHREIFVGTLAWFFAAINFSKIGPYAQLGLLDWTNLGTAVALLPVVPVGYLIGLRFLRTIRPALFVRIATIGLILTGIKLLWDAFGS